MSDDQIGAVDYSTFEKITHFFFFLLCKRVLRFRKYLLRNLSRKRNVLKFNLIFLCSMSHFLIKYIFSIFFSS
ncbi:hypothetical protein PUN28_000576 [Cardiocondyla obscurior]|uniref:Uncharacterized protein n=1 Tax=Cardiocondyla obscurior TaxID=286306 RepID=A0AAW2H0Q0_9HYME